MAKLSFEEWKAAGRPDSLTGSTKTQSSTKTSNGIPSFEEWKVAKQRTEQSQKQVAQPNLTEASSTYTQQANEPAAVQQTNTEPTQYQDQFAQKRAALDEEAANLNKRIAELGRIPETDENGARLKTDAQIAEQAAAENRLKEIESERSDAYSYGQKTRRAELEKQQKAAMDKLAQIDNEAAWALTTDLEADVRKRREEAQAELDKVRAELNNLDASKVQYADAERIFNANKGSSKTTAAQLGNALWFAADAYGQSQAMQMSPEDVIFAKAAGMDIEQYAEDKQNKWFDEDNQAFIEKGYDALSALNASGEADLAKATQNTSDLGALAVNTYVAGTQLAGDMIANAVLPGAGSALMAARAFGGGAMEARDAGATKAEQLAYGSATAAVSWGLEKIADVAGTYGSGVGDDVVERIVAKLAETDKGRTIARLIANAAAEGGEEFTESLIEPLLKVIYDKGEAAKLAYGSPEAIANTLGSALESYLVGMALGFVSGGVDIATGGAGAKNTKLRAQEIESQLGVSSAPDAQGVTQTPPTTAETSVEQTDELNSQANGAGEGANAKASNDVDAIEIMTGIPAENKKSASNEAGKNAGVTATVISHLRENIPNMQKVKPVAVAETSAVLSEDGATIAEKAKGLFERVKGIVSRPGFGDVEINNRSVKDDLSHGVGVAKAAVISTIPNVIQQGAQIDFQQNWKGRPYDGYVFAAPVVLDGKTVYVAAIVKKTSKNRFYLHEVVDSNGNIIKINDGEGANPTSLAPVDDAGTLSPSISKEAVASNDIIRQAEGKSNSELAKTDVDAEYNVLGEKYGTIEQGELAARESAVPTKLEDGSKVGQTARTVYEAEATPEARLADIRAAVVDGKLGYIPVTNKALGDEATAKIQRDGWTSSYVSWSEAVAAGKTSPKLVAMGAQLLNNAGNNPECSGATYVDLLTKYNKLVSNTGQSLSAARLLKRLSPEGKLYAITKSIEAIRDAANGKYDVNIDEALIQKYREHTTDKGRDAVITEIQKNIAEQIPTSPLEALNALSYLNMLGNFKTQGRNIIGNATSLVGRKIKDGVKQLLEVGKAKENRTASFFYSKQLGTEALADFVNVQDVALGDAKFGDYGKEFDKGIQDQREIFKIHSDWGKTEGANAVQRGARSVADVALKGLEGYRKATQWAMETGDMVFAKLAYADALAGYLQAKGIKSVADASQDTLDAARQYAIKQAQETTFRDKNILSDKAAKSAQGPIGKGVAPFRRTPANVLMRAAEYSPIGIVTAGVQSAQEVKAKKQGETTGRDITETWAKGLTGTALFALGYFLAKAGRLRTTEDDEKLDDFQQMRGAQNWSFVFDDGDNVTLDWLSPYSIPLFMGAALTNLDGESVGLEAFFEVSKSITGPMLEMSMLSGINDALESVSSWDDGSAVVQFSTNALMNLASRPFSNSLIRQAEQASEKERQTYYYDPESALSRNTQYTLSKLSASIPGWDYNTQDYMDAWGRTEESGSWFDAFLNPAYSSKDNSTKVDAELERLYEYGKTKDEFPNVLPSKADRSTTVNGERLSPKEYEQYSIEKGKTSLKYVSDFMESETYKLMNDEQRAETISDLYAMANAAAKKAVAQSRGGVYKSEAWDDELKLNNPAEYVAAKTVYDSSLDSGNYGGIDTLLKVYDDYSYGTQKMLSEKINDLDELFELAEVGVGAKPYFQAKESISTQTAAYDSQSDYVKLKGIGYANLSAAQESALVDVLLGKGANATYDAFTDAGYEWDDVVDFLSLKGSNKDGSANKKEKKSWMKKNAPEVDFDALWKILYP